MPGREQPRATNNFTTLLADVRFHHVPALSLSCSRLFCCVARNQLTHRAILDLPSLIASAANQMKTALFKFRHKPDWPQAPPLHLLLASSSISLSKRAPKIGPQLRPGLQKLRSTFFSEPGKQRAESMGAGDGPCPKHQQNHLLLRLRRLPNAIRPVLVRLRALCGKSGHTSPTHQMPFL